MVWVVRLAAGGPFFVSADRAQAVIAAAALDDPAMFAVGLDGEPGQGRLGGVQAVLLVGHGRQGDDVDGGGAAALGWAEGQGAQENHDADHDPTSASLFRHTDGALAADATMPTVEPKRKYCGGTDPMAGVHLGAAESPRDP